MKAQDIIDRLSEHPDWEVKVVVIDTARDIGLVIEDQNTQTPPHLVILPEGCATLRDIDKELSERYNKCMQRG